ncbi:MAG: CZB domain-containing protein [Bacteroidota bacterium]
MKKTFIKIDALISQHLKWKAQAENLFNEANCKTINPTIIGRDNCCDLGKWIDSPVSDFLSSNETFQQLKKAHKEFHLYAGRMLLECKSGDTNRAEAWLPLFHKSAEDVIKLLLELKKEIE